MAFLLLIPTFARTEPASPASILQVAPSVPATATPPGSVTAGVPVPPSATPTAPTASASPAPSLAASDPEFVTQEDIVPARVLEERPAEDQPAAGGAAHQVDILGITPDENAVGSPSSKLGPVPPQLPAMASGSRSVPANPQKTYEKLASLDPALIVGASVDAKNKEEAAEAAKVEVTGRLLIEEQPVRRRQFFRRYVLRTPDGKRVPLLSTMSLMAALRGNGVFDLPVKVAGKWVSSPSEPRLRFLEVESMSPQEVPDPEAILASSTKPLDGAGSVASGSGAVSLATESALLGSATAPLGSETIPLATGTGDLASATGDLASGSGDLASRSDVVAASASASLPTGPGPIPGPATPPSSRTSTIATVSPPLAATTSGTLASSSASPTAHTQPSAGLSRESAPPSSTTPTPPTSASPSADLSGKPAIASPTPPLPTPSAPALAAPLPATTTPASTEPGKP